MLALLQTGIMEYKQSHFRSDDDLDFTGLLDLLKRIMRWWETLLLDIVRVFARYWKGLLFYTGLALALSVGLYFVLPSKYELKMTLKTNQLANPNIQDQVYTLEKLSFSNSKNELSKALGLSVDQCKDIAEIRHEVIFPQYISPNPYLEHLPFRIVAVVKDRELSSDLQKAIVDYLENNPYALKNKAIRIKTLKARYVKITEEVAQIEQLKAAYLQSMSQTDKNVQVKVGNDVNPITFNEKSIELHQTLLDIENALEMDENISVIEGFASSDKADQPALEDYVFWGGVMGASLTFLFFLFNMRLQRRGPAEEQ